MQVNNVKWLGASDGILLQYQVLIFTLSYGMLFLHKIATRY